MELVIAQEVAAKVDAQVVVGVGLPLLPGDLHDVLELMLCHLVLAQVHQPCIRHKHQISSVLAQTVVAPVHGPPYTWEMPRCQTTP